MTISWWILWMAVMFLFILPSVGYGWGYRGWGPPYPHYIQHRRALRAAPNSVVFDHYSWGWRGDFLWTVLIIGVLFAFIELWR